MVYHRLYALSFVIIAIVIFIIANAIIIIGIHYIPNNSQAMPSSIYPLTYLLIVYILVSEHSSCSSLLLSFWMDFWFYVFSVDGDDIIMPNS